MVHISLNKVVVFVFTLIQKQFLIQIVIHLLYTSFTLKILYFGSNKNILTFVILLFISNIFGKKLQQYQHHHCILFDKDEM